MIEYAGLGPLGRSPVDTALLAVTSCQSESMWLIPLPGKQSFSITLVVLALPVMLTGKNLDPQFLSLLLWSLLPAEGSQRVVAACHPEQRLFTV